MAAQSDYLLQVEATFTPTERRVFLVKKVQRYVAGEPFTVGFKIRNKGKRPFHDQMDLTLNIELQHPDNRVVTVPVPFRQAKLLPPGEELKVKPSPTGALSEGTVLVTAHADPGIPALQIEDKFGQARTPGHALDSVYVTTWQEVYQYYAMLAAVSGLVAVVMITLADMVLRFLGIL